MRQTWFAVLLLVGCTSSLPAQNQPSDPLQLLDHLAGSWVLTGTIAGKHTTHDVQARWILHHEYLEIHEISREKATSGEPAYEAIVLVSWDSKANEYACLWLDSTVGGALTSKVKCRATPSNDAIPFVFAMSSTESLHTTFRYRRAADSWRWIIEDEANGKTSRFADVELSKTK